MSEPEKPEPKPGKRIVSKREYVRVQFVRYGLVFCSVLLVLSFILAYAITAVGVYIGAVEQFGGTRGKYLDQPNLVSIALAIAGVCLPLGSALFHLSRVSRRKANAMGEVLLLTRANTADLPAPESLVRASAEPLQAQETVLLRAASKGRATPLEQLVRPVEGQE